MILVQKPPTVTPSPFPLYAHRRHPSVPVVLPTRTPGLLILSKPPRSPPRSPPQHQNQHQSSKPLRKTKSTPVVRTPLPNLPAEITDYKRSGVIALPATPSPQPRVRGQTKHTRDGVQNHRKSLTPGGKHKHQLFTIPQSQSEVAVISSSDLSSGPGRTILNPNVQDVFGLVNNLKPSSKMLPSTPIRAIPFKRDSTSPSNGLLSEREAAQKAADYFASSMFQNSPGPEALPDPLLF